MNSHREHKTPVAHWGGLPDDVWSHVGAAAGCDLLILIRNFVAAVEGRSKDRSLRQLLHGLTAHTAICRILRNSWVVPMTRSPSPQAGKRLCIALIAPSMAQTAVPIRSGPIRFFDTGLYDRGAWLYWVTQLVVVVTRVTSPSSSRTSPSTSVLSMVWQVRSGGGGGVAGGGGGGLAHPARIAAQNASDSGAKTRFPRLFIG
jgi:hypothetical protein